ncbi:hypothetical protein REMIM1_PE00555 (plasmid) [Rhizobium etli bv. mimosae str. Mim1]|nr:hypothetical protein REMIM1_PE00555 [Rhizobium etli bv. mimosae str. Mim1]
MRNERQWCSSRVQRKVVAAEPISFLLAGQQFSDLMSELGNFRNLGDLLQVPKEGRDHAT